VICPACGAEQQGRLVLAEILVEAGYGDDARVAVDRAREAAARKGSTVLVARADELLVALRQLP
jgi:hypothetical protein